MKTGAAGGPPGKPTILPNRESGGAHLLEGLRQCPFGLEHRGDHPVQVLPMLRSNFVGRDEVGVVGLDCAEGVALDARIRTKPPTGSQDMPRWCSSAIVAAISVTSSGWPVACVIIAAAIAEASALSAQLRLQ